MNEYVPWLIGGTAIFGIVIAAWSRFKAILWRFVSLFIVRARTEASAGVAVAHYCLTTMKRSPFSEKRFAGEHHYVRVCERVELIAFELIGSDPSLFWYGRWPIIIKVQGYGANGGSSESSNGPRSDLEGLPVTVTAIRGSIDLDRFILEAVEAYNASRRALVDSDYKRYRVNRKQGIGSRRGDIFNRGAQEAHTGRKAASPVFEKTGKRLLRWSATDIGEPQPDQPFKALALSTESMVAVSEAERWLKSEKWYRNRRILWRYGMLFWGPPGCLHADTVIFDPVDGTKLTVQERHRLRKSFHVFSRTEDGGIVVTKAEAPVRYPVADMVKLTLKTGDCFTVTPWHRLWSGSEWLPVRTFVERLQLCGDARLPSISESVLSIRIEGDRRSTQKASGYRDGYSSDSYPHDALLQQDEEIALSVSPSLDDAQLPHLAELRMGVAVDTDSDICQPSECLLSKKGYAPHSALRTAGVYVLRSISALCASVADGCRTLWIRWRETFRLHTSRQQLRVATDSRHSDSRDFCIQAELEVSGRHETDCNRKHARSPSAPPQNGICEADQQGRQEFCASFCLSNSVWRTEEQNRDTEIVKIETVPPDVYYDFHVPKLENYWACGVWHHNTGKTSTARAIAQQLDLPVFAYDLASFSNTEFINAWKEMLSETPCMALLEDVDAVFHGRENVLGEEGGGLTFDCLLNCLSGIEQADGVLTIVTTNREELLDDALGRPMPGDRTRSTRPGRIDRAVHFGTMNEACRRQVAERILGEWPEEIEELVNSGYQDSGAEFTDRCCRIALQKYWSEKPTLEETTDGNQRQQRLAAAS